MRVFYRCLAGIAVAVVCSSLASSHVRADGLYSVTDLGAASPSAAYLSGQTSIDPSGNYLPLLTAGQQAAFQAGSFDVYSHPATTSLRNTSFFESPYAGGYDIVNRSISLDQIVGFQMTTSNNVGVTVGTATEDSGEGNLNRLVEFTANPHQVNEYNFGSSQQVQSPGYVNILWTTASTSSIVFSGTATGVNDHNNVIFNENSYASSPNSGYVNVLVPHMMTTSRDTSLGTLGGANGVANALNNSNQVVGWSQIASGAQHAFLYSNGSMQDLNLLIPPASGITLTDAVGIDAAGEIVAYGTNAAGQTQEYFLTPAEVPAPEPSMLAVMGLMIATLAARQARERFRNR